VTCREGHFLTYGVRDPFALPHGIRVADLCREVHRQEGAVVAAHPFRWGQRFDEIMEKVKPELDGLELRTSNMDEDCRRRAAVMQKTFNLAGLGSSDAHSESVLGFCYTEFDAPVRNARELVAAIRSRRSSAHDGIASKS
jgi:predicted metal-dependent phosphoesterase TrpH